MAELQTQGDTESFALKEGARPPSEAELRKKLTPGAVGGGGGAGRAVLACWVVRTLRC